MKIYGEPPRRPESPSFSELKRRLDHVQRCIDFINGKDEPEDNRTPVAQEPEDRIEWLLRNGGIS